MQCSAGIADLVNIAFVSTFIKHSVIDPLKLPLKPPAFQYILPASKAMLTDTCQAGRCAAADLD